MNKTLKKYIDALMEKRWSIISEDEKKIRWVVDKKSKKWIIRIDDHLHNFTTNYEFITDTGDLIDLNNPFVYSDINIWIREFFKIPAFYNPKTIITKYGIGKTYNEYLEKNGFYDL